jgi:hypothetical protein
MTEKNKIDLTIQDANEISPYDASYPVMLLSNGIKKELERAQLLLKAYIELLLEKCLL